jgi:hypothetical protein
MNYVDCCDHYIGLIFGLAAFSQIIYPLFVARPRAKRLEREGGLKKPIPNNTFFTAPFVWGALICVSIWIVARYMDRHLILYLCVLGVMLIVVAVQIPKKNKDFEADFKETWKEYLKE